MAVAKWSALSATWYLLRAGVAYDAAKIAEALLSSAALTTLWYAFMYATGIQVEDAVGRIIDRLPRHRIEISEELLLEGIRNSDPLWSYYSDWLRQLPERIVHLNGKDGKLVEVDPYAMYSMILSCTSNCRQEIASVDCDLGAWYYVCELEDFDWVYASDPEALKGHKELYVAERRSRGRIDFTSKLAQIQLERLSEGSDGALLGKAPLRRVLVVQHAEGELPAKERMILRRMSRLQSSVKGRMRNRILFLEDWDAAPADLRTLLNELQDIVIFDGKVAFVEFLLHVDDKKAHQGEIHVSPAALKLFASRFDELFKDWAKDIHDVACITDSKGK